MKLNNFRVVLQLTWKDVKECYRVVFKAASKLLKHFLALILCAAIFSVDVRAFASFGELVTVKPTIPTLSTSVATWLIEYSLELGENVQDDFLLLQKGALYWFFTVLVNDTYGATTDTFCVMDKTYSITPHSVRAVSNGRNMDKFDDDYFHTYFSCIANYCSFNLSASYEDIPDCKAFVTNYFYEITGRNPHFLSDFPCSFVDIFFYASDPGSTFISGFECMLPGNEPYVKKYFDYLYADYLRSNGLSEVSAGYDNITDIDNFYKKPVISAEDFKESIEEQNKRYSPKTANNKLSYRNEEYYSTMSGINPAYLTLYSPSSGFCKKFSDMQIYMLPFYTNGENTYYGQYQFRFWCIPEEDDNGNDINAFYLSFFDMLDPDPMIAPVSTQRVATYKETSSFVGPVMPGASPSYSLPGTYFTIPSYGYSPMHLCRHDTLREYSVHSASSYGYYYFNLPESYNLYINSRSFDDLLNVSQFGSHLIKKHSEHDKDCPYGEFDDIGYYCSTVPISIVYPFDTSRIPDNYVITINGDTVYDYSITNPETGETDTINNYVTNNYTFTGSGNGGGGEAGGNITVGGKIDVGGTVDVKVDVNVNGGSSYDFPDMPDMDPLNEYLNSAVEESGGVRLFLKTFFDFLPPEMVMLILIGLTLVVIRICLRR